MNNHRVDYTRKAASKYFKIVKALFKPREYFIYPKKQYGFHRVSFSQEGEDLALARIFENQSTGFFVDVGAHHPQRFSNTYYFYLLGWRGINIDAMPGSMNLFNRFRPKDINLEIPISTQVESLTYHTFNEPALNTFSEELAKEYGKLEGYEVIEVKQLKADKLSNVLQRHLEPGQKIDFMSVDVEGFDYDVLLSNDWVKFKPKAIVVEDLAANHPGQGKPSISEFLHEKGYILKSKLINSLIFIQA